MGKIRRRKNKWTLFFLIGVGCIAIAIVFYLYIKIPYDKVNGYFENQLNYTHEDMDSMYERRGNYLTEELIESSIEDSVQQERRRYLAEHKAVCTLEMLVLGEMDSKMQIPFEVWYTLQYEDEVTEEERIHWTGKVTVERSWGFLCRISELETTHTCLQTGERETHEEQEEQGHVHN